MRYVETLVDCLITPIRGSLSQPDINDVFLETPLGLGSSTKLDSGTIQHDWDAIDKDINYLEALSKRIGSVSSTQVKLGYERILTTLIQTERELQINGQYGDILAVDCRRDRLYRTKRFRQVRPIHYGDDKNNGGDNTGLVVGGAASLITILKPVKRQEIGAPGIDRGDDGQTRFYSIAAGQVVVRDGQLAAYAPGYCQEVRSLVDSGDSGQTRVFSNAASQVVDSDGQLTAYTPGERQEVRPLVDSGDSGQTRVLVNEVGQVVGRDGQLTTYRTETEQLSRIERDIVVLQ